MKRVVNLFSKENKLGNNTFKAIISLFIFLFSIFMVGVNSDKVDAAVLEYQSASGFTKTNNSTQNGQTLNFSTTDNLDTYSITIKTDFAGKYTNWVQVDDVLSKTELSGVGPDVTVYIYFKTNITTASATGTSSSVTVNLPISKVKSIDKLHFQINGDGILNIPANWNMYFKISDVTAPTDPTMTCASCGSWQSSNFSASASGGSDKWSGVSKYQYKVGSGSWTDGSSYTVSSDVNSTLYFRACDGAGNCSSGVSKTIKLDKTAPVLSIYSQPNSTYISASTTSFIVGVAIEDSMGFGSIRALTTNDFTLSVGGTSINSYISNVYLASSDAVSSHNEIYVIGLSGFQGTLSIAINSGIATSNSNKSNVAKIFNLASYVDQVAPSVTFYAKGSSASEYGYSNSSSITTTITASDGGSGLNTYYMYTARNGSTYVLHSSSTTKPTSVTIQSAALSSGYNYQLQLQVTDKAGNTAYVSEYLLYDTVNPLAPMTLTCALCGSWTNQTVSVTISGATDTNSDIAGYEFSYDKSSWSTSWTGTGAYNNSTGAYGTWTTETDSTVYFRAYDKAGNKSPVSSKSARIMIDKTAPTTNITATSSVLNKNGTYQFSVYFLDTKSKGSSSLTTSNMTIYVGNTAVSATTYIENVYGDSTSEYYNVTLTNLTGNGTLSVSIIVGAYKDKAGNSSPSISKRTLGYVDNTLPTIYDGSKYLQDGSSYAYSGSVTITVDDNYDLYYVQDNGGTWDVSAPASNTYETSGRQVIKLVDQAGNSTNVVLCIDPSVSVFFDFNSSTTRAINSSGSVEFYLQVEATNTRAISRRDLINYLSIYVVNSTVSSDNITLIQEYVDESILIYAISVTGLTGDGYLYASLSSGWITYEGGIESSAISKTNLSVYVDNTAPTISTYRIMGKNSPTPWYTNSTSVKIDVSASDNYSITNYFIYQGRDPHNAPRVLVNGSKPSSSSTYTVQAISAGYTLEVRDVAGNVATQEGYLYYDAVSPTISLSGYKVFDSYSAYATSQDSLTVTISDNLGLAYIEDEGMYTYMWCEYFDEDYGYDMCIVDYWLPLNTSRTEKEVKHTFQLSSISTGVWYLIIEGISVWDKAGNDLASNNNLYSQDYYRVYKVVIDDAAPTLSLSGAYSVYDKTHYAKPSDKLTLTFEDENGLLNNASTSYYRYMWCTGWTSGSSVTGCGNWTSTATRTYKKVTMSISLTGKSGTYYLAVEGDAKDFVNHGVIGSDSHMLYNPGASAISSSSYRVYRIFVDNVAPNLSIFQLKGENALAWGYANSTTLVMETDAADDETAIIQYKIVATYQISYTQIALDAIAVNNLTSQGYICGKESAYASYWNCTIHETHTSTIGTYTSKPTTIEGLSRAATYTLTVTDRAGNTASRTSTTVTYDVEDPVITSDLQLIGDYCGVCTGNIPYTDSLEILYSFTATDSNGYYHRLYDTNVTYQLGITASLLSATLNSGNYGARTVTLYVYDFAGNVATSTATIIYDPTPATVSFTAEGNTGYEVDYTNSTIEYSLTAIEDNGQIFYYVIEIEELYNGQWYSLDLAYESGLICESMHTISGTVDLLDYVDGSGGIYRLRLYLENTSYLVTEAYSGQIILDFLRPTIQSFTVVSGTYGSLDGGQYKYVDGDSIDLQLAYIEPNYYSYSLQLIGYETTCTPSPQLTSTTTVKYITFTCDISDVPANYMSLLTYSIILYDKAGNASTTVPAYFYRIDETTKIEITRFIIHARGAKEINYVGKQDVTEGKIAPQFTVSNDTYLDINRMFLGISNERNIPASENWVYCIDISYCRGVVQDITTEYYITIESGYAFDDSITIEEWYDYISEGVGYVDLHLWDIFGREVESCITITFDFTDPFIVDNLWVDTEDSLLQDYVNDDNVKLHISMEDNYGISEICMAGTDDLDDNCPELIIVEGIVEPEINDPGPTGVVYYRISALDYTLNVPSSALAATINIYYVIYDNAGNKYFEHTEVYYDTVAPTFTREGGDEIVGGSNKIDGIYYAQLTKSFVFNLKDNYRLSPYDSVNHATYYWSKSATELKDYTTATNKGNSNNSNVKYSLTVTTPSTTGDWYLWVYNNQHALKDMAGNYINHPDLNKDKNAIIIHFVIDNEAPVITITHLGAGSAHNNKYYVQPGEEVVVTMIDNAALAAAVALYIRYQDEDKDQYEMITGDFRCYNWSRSGASQLDNISECSNQYTLTLKAAQEKVIAPDLNDKPNYTGAWYLWVVSGEWGYYDAAGNAVVTRIFEFIVDDKAPTTTNVNGQEDAPGFRVDSGTGLDGYVNKNLVLIGLMLYDDYGMRDFTATYDYGVGSKVIIGGRIMGDTESGTYTYGMSTIIDGISDGLHEVVVEICDLAGNCRVVSKPVIRDTVTPYKQMGVMNEEFEYYSDTATVEIELDINLAKYLVPFMYDNVRMKTDDVQQITLSNYQYMYSKERIVGPEEKLFSNDSFINGSILPLATEDYYLYINTTSEEGNLQLFDAAGNLARNAMTDGRGGYIIEFKIHTTYASGTDKKDFSVITDEQLMTDDDPIKIQVQPNLEMSMIIITLENETGDPGYASIGDVANLLVNELWMSFGFDNSNSWGQGINSELYNFEFSGGVVNADGTISSSNNQVFENILLTTYDVVCAEFVTVIIVDNRPQIGTGNNAPSSTTLTQGEELGNIGLSFVDSDNLTITEQITLNGVKVNKIDTNKTGVYSIKTIATDAMGRSRRVEREIIIEPRVNEVKEAPVKEVIVSQEIIEPVKEVETKTNETTTRRVNSTNTQQVAMRVEKKEEIKTYKKKELKKNEKKEHFTFKLFSKWFFKVYDG